MDAKIVLAIVLVWALREWFSARKIREMEETILGYYRKIGEEKRKNAADKSNEAHEDYNRRIVDYFDKYGNSGPKGGSA